MIITVLHCRERKRREGARERQGGRRGRERGHEVKGKGGKCGSKKKIEEAK